MRRGLIILVLSFVLIAAVYRRTPMNFLRAESGWFLFNAYSTSEIQPQFQKGFFLASYCGHYTPLAFWAEFEMAKVAGTNESIWKWRQILALTLISAALVGTLHAIGREFQVPPLTRWMMAIAVTAGSVYRPEMMDFISWPFLIFQLVFVGLLILALYSVLRVVTSPDQRRWPWVAVLAAYGSMHVSGLGLVTVSAVAVVLGGILLLAFRSPDTIYHPPRKRIASALITMVCLAAAHGWAMLHLLPPSQPPLVVAAGPFCKLLLGFTANLAVTGLRTFIGTTISEPDSRSLAYSWPYGLLLVAGALLLLRWSLRHALKEPTSQNVTRFALHAFSIAAFAAVIGLSAVRLFHIASLNVAAAFLALSNFLPRYVVLVHFVMIASAAEIFARLAQRAPRFCSGAFCAIALAALAAQVDFRINSFPCVAPLARISHTSAWRLIISTVRECRAAQLPVPNVPLGALTQEFSDWDLKMFEPLVRSELRLGRGEQIEMISWEEYLQNERGRYRSRVPSLQLLEQKLYLQVD